MTDSEEKKAVPGVQETSIEDRRLAIEDNFNDPVTLVERVYLLWWRWADFHLYVVSPTFDDFYPPRVVEPAPLSNASEYEFVYPIVDFGHKLSTSKGAEMYSAGMSMCKLYFTIEKMIAILVERMQSRGVTAQEEVQVAFGGHELAQRKAFESIINLPYNVVVSNFDPGAWGERYLQNVKAIADKGFGYPTETPRDSYKQPYASSGSRAKR